MNQYTIRKLWFILCFSGQTIYDLKNENAQLQIKKDILETNQKRLQNEITDVKTKREKLRTDYDKLKEVSYFYII